MKKSEFKQRIRKDIIKKRLLNKLTYTGVEKLNQNARFVKLLDMVNNIAELFPFSPPRAGEMFLSLFSND